MRWCDSPGLVFAFRSLLLLLICWLSVWPLAAQEATAGEPSVTVWDLGTLAPDTAYPSEIEAQNLSCRGRHDFVVRVPEDSWLRVEGPTRLERIRRGQAKTTAVVIDTTGLRPGEHEAVVRIDCVTCPPPPVCSQDVRRLVVRLTIPGDPEAGGSDPDAGWPCECSELEALWRAAEEALRQAEAELQRLVDEQEEVGKRRQKAEAEFDEAEERVDGLKRFFDDSSWIDGDRGRITRGDLELLREVRRDVYDRWKAGEISAEEAADAWGEIGSEDLEELRREKQRELESAEKARDEAQDESSRLGREAAQAADRTDGAEDAVRRATQEEQSARELYETCLAECRDALVGRIDDHTKVLDKLERDCPPIPWDEIEKELRAMEERSQDLAEAVADGKKNLDRSLQSLLRAQELNRIGQELPAMPTGLWDWGEDVGRFLGRPFGIEDVAGDVGEVAAATLGTVAEDFAGFPIGTDAVKAVASAYKGVFGALHPDSVSLGRCIERAFPQDAQGQRTKIDVAWKESRSFEDHLTRLADATRQFGQRRQEIRQLVGELRTLGPAPEAPGLPGPDATLEELAGYEEELGRYRESMAERCARQQKLLERLRQAIGAARGALVEIGSVAGTLQRITEGAALYREYLRRVGPLNCL